MPIFRSVQLYSYTVLSRHVFFSNLPCRQFFRKNVYSTARKDENNDLDPLQKFLGPPPCYNRSHESCCVQTVKIIIFNLYVALAMDGWILFLGC